MGIAAVDHDQQWLDVRFSDGTTSRFLGSWLRDNIASGRHRSGGQRTFDINDLPAITIAGATHADDTVTVALAPEGLDGIFDEEWFRRHSQTGTSAPDALSRPTLWGAELQSTLSFEDYPSLLGDPTRLHDWLVQVRDFGFGLVENVPTAPGSVVKVVELFGYVRETNYGQVLATPTKTRCTPGSGSWRRRHERYLRTWGSDG